MSEEPLSVPFAFFNFGPAEIKPAVNILSVMARVIMLLHLFACCLAQWYSISGSRTIFRAN